MKENPEIKNKPVRRAVSLVRPPVPLPQEEEDEEGFCCGNPAHHKR